MASEIRRLALGFGILMQRDCARHSSPVLGDMGVVALQNDPLSDRYEFVLGENEAAPAGNDVSQGPRRGTEKVQKHMVASIFEPPKTCKKR